MSSELPLTLHFFYGPDLGGLVVAGCGEPAAIWAERHVLYSARLRELVEFCAAGHVPDRAVPSREAVANSAPIRLNAIPRTRIAVMQQVLFAAMIASQIRAILLSWLAVASRRPSGLNVTRSTQVGCLRLCCCSRVATSKIRA